jgi:threonyl-tRNA synthetase
MIENYGGAFPMWLAPVQIAVATITSDADSYAEAVAAKLTASGLRVTVDMRNEKINYKVREHSLSRLPYIAVIGRKEMESGQVVLRKLGSTDQLVLTVEEALDMLISEATPPDLKRGRSS